MQIFTADFNLIKKFAINWLVILIEVKLFDLFVIFIYNRKQLVYFRYHLRFKTILKETSYQ